MASLEDRFHTYALDVPGDGLFDPIDFTDVDYREFTVKLFDEFLDAIGVERATFVGNSRGGYQTLVVALDRPELIYTAVLVGAVPGLSSGTPLTLWTMGTPGLDRIFLALIWRPNTDTVRRLYDRLVVDDSVIPSVFYECLAHNRALPGRVDSLRTWAESVVTLGGPAPEMLVGDEMRDLDIPGRFLWGDRDSVTPPSVGREVAAKMVNTEFVELENAGHMPWLEPASSVSESIAESVLVDSQT